MVDTGANLVARRPANDDTLNYKWRRRGRCHLLRSKEILGEGRFQLRSLATGQFDLTLRLVLSTGIALLD